MTVLTIFALITIGAIIGFLSNLIMKEKGIKLIPSVIVGIIAAGIGGTITFNFGLKGYGLYAMLAATVVLFTVNVFRTKKRPVFETE